MGQGRRSVVRKGAHARKCTSRICVASDLKTKGRAGRWAEALDRDDAVLLPVAICISCTAAAFDVGEPSGEQHRKRREHRLRPHEPRFSPPPHFTHPVSRIYCCTARSRAAAHLHHVYKYGKDHAYHLVGAPAGSNYRKGPDYQLDRLHHIRTAPCQDHHRICPCCRLASAPTPPIHPSPAARASPPLSPDRRSCRHQHRCRVHQHPPAPPTAPQAHRCRRFHLARSSRNDVDTSQPAIRPLPFRPLRVSGQASSSMHPHHHRPHLRITLLEDSQPHLHHTCSHPHPHPQCQHRVACSRHRQLHPHPYHHTHTRSSFPTACTTCR